MLEGAVRAASSRPSRSLIVGLTSLMLAWLASAASGQMVPYTVQVVALSDQAAALSVQNDLIRSGYPAYVVRAISEQGDVYRVRVGAFADRNSALLYASGMPLVSGSEPVPALAQGIPGGIMPLAPRLVADLETAGLDVLLGRVPGGIAVRTQVAEPLAQADYLLLLAGEARRFQAWRLGVDDDGELIRLRELLLWPDNWPNDPDDVRVGYRNSLLSLVAERLAVPVEDLAEAEYQPGPDAPPTLLVIERGFTSLLEGSDLLGVGLPPEDMSAFGPEEFLRAPAWPEGEALPGLEDVLTLAELLALEPPVAGSGWQATPDGEFVRLTVTEPEAAGVQATTAAGTTWRAGLGRPLWSDGRYLFAWLDDRLLIYDFVRR